MNFNKFELENISRLLLSEEDNNKLIAVSMLEGKHDAIISLRYAVCLAAYLNKSFREEVEWKIEYLLYQALSPIQIHYLQDCIMILDYARYKFKVKGGWHVPDSPLTRFLKIHKENLPAFKPYLFFAKENFAQYYWVLGKRILEEMKNVREAMYFFELALELHPEHKSARISYASILHQHFIKKGKRLTDYKMAIDYYISGYSTPKQMTPYIQAALLAKEMEDFEKSEALYLKGISLAPDNSTLLNNYANLLLELGNFQKAREYVNLGLNHVPSDPFLLDTLAQIEMVGFKDLDKAESLFKQVVNSSDIHHYSHTGLGDIYVLKEDFQNAIYHYKKGLYNGMAFSSRDKKEVIEKLEKIIACYKQFDRQNQNAAKYKKMLARLQK